MLSFGDVVEPEILSADYTRFDSTITVSFNEPMDFSTIENSEYYILVNEFDERFGDDDPSVISATLVRSNNGIREVELVLSEQPDQNSTITSAKIRVSPRVLDLAGNGMILNKMVMMRLISKRSTKHITNHTSCD